jgi:hypothetical protein
MKRLLSYSLLILLLSCQNKDGKQASASKLTSFQGFPPGIEGCSCYFGASEKDFMKEKYLFVSDMDSVAHISINGQMKSLKLSSTSADQNALRESNYQEVFSDQYYKLILDVRYKGETGEEVWQSEGDMILFFKDTPVDSTYFIGECGC